MLLFIRLSIVGLSLADSFVTRRTRKGNFLNQIDQLIDWTPIEKTIAQYYAPASDATGRPAYPGLLLFKMLLVGLWHGGLSDESVEDMANANLHAMRFLGLAGTDQPANTGTPGNSNKRLSHRCEHYAQPAQAQDKTGV